MRSGAVLMTGYATLSREQFTQTDPMPSAVGSPYESSYVYVGNNPLVYVDPTGLRGSLPGCPWLWNPIAAAAPRFFVGVGRKSVPSSSIPTISRRLVPLPRPSGVGRPSPTARVTPAGDEAACRARCDARFGALHDDLLKRWEQCLDGVDDDDLDGQNRCGGCTSMRSTLLPVGMTSVSLVVLQGRSRCSTRSMTKTHPSTSTAG